MLSGYKTLIASSLLVVLGAFQGLDWVNLIQDPEIAGWTVAGIGAAMAVLRFLTTTPVGVKKF